ncbi:16106_t:CDS:1, partial [Rhizophagus irregularis]
RILLSIIMDHTGPHHQGHYHSHIAIDHVSPHYGGHYCPHFVGPWWSSQWRTLLSAHYWRTMMVLTMEDIIVRALLEDHDGPHNGGHHCPHIIGGS